MRQYNTPTLYARKQRVARYDCNGNRWCGHCKTFKPESDFKPSAQRYRTATCRECDRQQARKRNAKVISYLWYRRYGVSEQQYWQTFDDQNGRCAACGRQETKVKRNGYRLLSVDHNHETGEVRALLCQGCNVALGYASEDPTVLRKLADYIEAFA